MFNDMFNFFPGPALLRSALAMAVFVGYEFRTKGKKTQRTCIRNVLDYQRNAQIRRGPMKKGLKNLGSTMEM
jgi:hypothetical protein